MKVVQKKTGDGMLELDCTASTGDVSYVLNAMQRQFCKQMGVNMVQGKSPAECAEAQMGIKDLDRVVEPQAIEALVPMALDKRGIVPAYKPTPEPKTALRRGKTFSFTMKVAPKPEYELSSYDPIEITVDPMPDYTDDVNAQLAAIAEQYYTYTADDPHPVEKGNDIKLSMECSVNGEKIKNLCSDDRIYSVGLGYMPEGFDDSVIGMNVGETKTFTFDAPDLDENAKEITVQAEATVTILEIQKRIAPVLNDEWVAQYMPMYKSYDEMVEEITKTVGKQKKAKYDEYLRTVAADKVSELLEATIPDEVYEGALQTLTTNLRQQMGTEGLTWDQFVEQNGGEQNLNMMLMMQTRSVLRQGYSLDAIFRHEGLVITDEDLDDICKAINPRNPKQARQQLEDSGNGQQLRESAERLRANKWLVDHAKITVRDRETPQTGLSGATTIG